MILEKIKEYALHFSFYLSGFMSYLLSHDFVKGLNEFFSTLGVIIGTTYSGFLLYVLIRDKIYNKDKDK